MGILCVVGGRREEEEEYQKSRSRLGRGEGFVSE